MSLLHNITLFDLIVYNDDEKRFLGAGSFILFLDKEFVKKRFGVNHSQMVEQKWISPSWLDFIKWYKGSWRRFLLQKKIYLYRGIRYYNLPALRRILKYGNDRYENIRYYSDTADYMKEKYGIDNTGWIFAKKDLSEAWNFANDSFSWGQNGVRLVLIYDPDFLKYIYGNVYVLQQGVRSFKDGLFGIIRVKFI